MSLHEDEMNQIKLTIIEAVKPLSDKVLLLDQTVRGNGDGLCSRVKELESKVTDLGAFKRQVYSVVAAMQVIGAGIITWLKLGK